MPSKSPFTMSTAGVCRAAMAARFEVTGWSLGAGSGHDKCFGEMIVLADGRLPGKARGRSLAVATPGAGVRSAGPVFEERLISRRRSLRKSPGCHRRA